MKGYGKKLRVYSLASPATKICVRIYLYRLVRTKSVLIFNSRNEFQTIYTNKNKTRNKYDIERQRIIQLIYQNNSATEKNCDIPKRKSSIVRWTTRGWNCIIMMLITHDESTTVGLIVHGDTGLFTYLSIIHIIICTCFFLFFFLLILFSLFF